MKNISHKRLKRPPYSAYLCAALCHPEKWPQYAGTSPDGTCVSIFLIVGSKAWKKASTLENSHLFLMLPPGDDPLLYDWTPLRGHDPIIGIIEGDPPSEKGYYNLASALIRNGVQRFIRPGNDGSGVRHLSEEVILCTA